MKQKDRLPSSKTFDDMGLWLYRKKLCYTAKGFGARWMPTFVKRKIVCVWNKISCLIFGHYFFSKKTDKYKTCCDCLVKRKNK